MENLQDLEKQILAKIEAEIKPRLGDLWIEFKDDAQEWAKIIAQLELDIALGKHPITNALAHEHVAKIGIPSFVCRARLKTEHYIASFLGSVLQFVLEAAILTATLYFEKKTNKLL